MITCEYIGRLGNNMFQIAAAASLAHRNGDVFDGVSWAYGPFFEFSSDIIFSGQKKNFPRFSENGFHYTEIPYQKDIELYGYFQSEKYFDKEYVRSIFKLKKSYREEALNKYSGHLSQKTLSYHIRRTDYIQVQHQHPLQPLEYFQKATLKVEEVETIDKILVFSDDIEYCKNNFKDDRCIFIEGESDFVDMFLMSECDHNVISNSSFSWWGAWMNDNPNKIVIAPEKWFGPHYSHLETGDIYSEGWIKI